MANLLGMDAIDIAMLRNNVNYVNESAADELGIVKHPVDENEFGITDDNLDEVAEAFYKEELSGFDEEVLSEEADFHQSLDPIDQEIDDEIDAGMELQLFNPDYDEMELIDIVDGMIY